MAILHSKPICNWKEDFLPLQPSKCLIFWRKYFRGNEKWRRTKSQFVGSLFWTHYWQENDKKSISPFMAVRAKWAEKQLFHQERPRPRRRPAKKNPDGRSITEHWTQIVCLLKSLRVPHGRQRKRRWPPICSKIKQDNFFQISYNCMIFKWDDPDIYFRNIKST